MRKPTPVGVRTGVVKTLTRLMEPLSATKKNAFKRRIQSLKKDSVNKLTGQFDIMTIPKEIETQGTIMNTRDENLIIKLPVKIMEELKDIYKMSAIKQQEYAGLIEFTFDTNYAIVKSHTMRTNYKREAVAPPQRTKATKVMYHSHPAPPNVGTTLVSIPSEMDISAYIKAQKKGVVEGNLILDQQGVYVIDVVNFNKRNDIFKYFLNLVKLQNGLQYTIKNNFFFMNIDINTWQKFINEKVDKLLKQNFGVSMKFYKWSEQPTIRISS